MRLWANKRGLSAGWNKKERDVDFWAHTVPGPDRSLLYYTFSVSPEPGKKSFVEELKARGYDITTIKFSIEKFPPPPPPSAVMARAGAVGVDADGAPVP